jgi:hypothetical protein
MRTQPFLLTVSVTVHPEKGAFEMTRERHTTKLAAAGVAAALASVAVLAATGTGAAAATYSCPAQPMKQAFSSYGDSNQYFFAPNGGFENGTTGWTLGAGATVVSGSETAYLNSSSDSKSMKLPANGWVRTGQICIDTTQQVVRLMVKGTSGQLKVDAKVVSGGNIRTWSTQVDASSSAGWRPSQQIQFAQGSNQFLGATTLQLTFTAIGATWQVDDLYVDPFKST